MTATADDGHPVRGWLVLPDGACESRPAPLLLWVHGGPMSSWNGWQWRWNPWLAAARGYAVLLPDPALSTGYGLDFIARGYASGAPRPFADLMAITDAVRPAGHRRDPDGRDGRLLRRLHGELDRRRTPAASGVRVARQALGARPMFGTTDGRYFWRREFGQPLTEPGGTSGTRRTCTSTPSARRCW